MERSNRCVDMNEVYAHTKTTRKEQPAIRLRHMSGGPNDCRRQPRSRFAVVVGKSNVEPWQYEGDQFRALEDQLETLPTQISNLCHHKGNGSKIPSTEHRTHERQHHAQAHSTWWVDGSKLKILEFPRILQPSKFWHWMLVVEEVFEFNGVLDEQRISLVVHTFQGVIVAWWQYVKQRRRHQGKSKISSWEQLLKELRVTFVP
jgi:hypothetical protein